MFMPYATVGVKYASTSGTQYTKLAHKNFHENQKKKSRLSAFG